MNERPLIQPLIATLWRMVSPPGLHQAVLCHDFWTKATDIRAQHTLKDDLLAMSKTRLLDALNVIFVLVI